MPKPKTVAGQTCPQAFQGAIDALDVIGSWEWDCVSDSTRSDAFVALLFNLDPDEAEAGTPLSGFIAGIHPEDRQRVLALILQNAQEGCSYVAEYRVCSADGVTRWVLGRGRFYCDHKGRPLSGRGIIVDITQLRAGETIEDLTNADGTATPLERAVDHAVAAQRAIVELQDPVLKALADSLLFDLGRKLAQQEVRERRKHMN